LFVSGGSVRTFVVGNGPPVVSCRIPWEGRAVTHGGVVGHGRR
jgi:hypothetical protein